MRLKDKVALITGAGSGIGEATSLKFAEEGAKVAICDVDMENANRVAKEIASMGGDSLVLKADVSNKEEVEGMMAQIKEHFGRQGSTSLSTTLASTGTPLSRR
jgi:3-oxoacyl-[acyl-carrier protein] reductase